MDAQVSAVLLDAGRVLVFPDPDPDPGHLRSLAAVAELVSSRI